MRKPVANAAIPEEVAQRASEIQKAKVDNRNGYNQELARQREQQQMAKKLQRDRELEEARASSGFEFECYTRDRLM